MGNYLQLLYHYIDNSVIYANRRWEGPSLQIIQINLIFTLNFSFVLCYTWEQQDLFMLVFHWHLCCHGLAWKDRKEGEAGQLRW